MKARIFLTMVICLVTMSGLLAQPETTIHVVQRGESMWTIAGGDIRIWLTIRSTNSGIKNPDLIFPGQEILVPGEEEEELMGDVGRFLEEAEAQIEKYRAETDKLRQAVEAMEVLSQKWEKLAATSPISSSLTSPPMSTTLIPPAPHRPVTVWLDGAYCLQDNSAGYGARECGAGFSWRSLSVYSGTQAAGGMALAKVRLGRPAFGGLSFGPLLSGGFRAINMNFGRDLATQPALLTNARPFAAAGFSVVYSSRYATAWVDWLGWANDIKQHEPLIDPYHMERIEWQATIGGNDFSLFSSGVCYKGFLPEWQVLAMVAAGNGYRVGVGYGRQNPYAESHTRAMGVARVEKSLSF